MASTCKQPDRRIWRRTASAIVLLAALAAAGCGGGGGGGGTSPTNNTPTTPVTPVTPAPETLFTADNRWTEAAPGDAETITPDEFRRLKDAGEIEVVTSSK